MRRKMIKYLFLTLLTASYVLFVIMPVLAVSDECRTDCVMRIGEGEAVYDACIKACPSGSNYDPSNIPPLFNPLQLNVKGDSAATKKISVYAGGAIQVVLGIVGSISLVMFIYAGIRYMLARGNAEEAKAAGNIMAWAAMGLAVIFGSYVILQFIFSALTG